MPEWIDALPLHELAEGTPVKIKQEGRSIVLCRVGEAVYAVENRCPHADMPLAEGSLDGCILTCPYHGYSYDLRTGKNVDEPVYEPPVRTFPVRIEGPTVQVALEESQPEAE